MKNGKHRLLKALFAEANKLGIDQETLREDIVPGVIGKRLSKASPQEVARVLDYLKGKDTRSDTQNSKWRRYESSRAGLIQEIIDIAKERFGEDYARPLNAFCAKFGEADGFRKMRVSQMKAVKQRLKELNRKSMKCRQDACAT